MQTFAGSWTGVAATKPLYDQAPTTVTCNAAVQPFFDSPLSPASAFKFLLPADHNVVDFKSEDIFFSNMSTIFEFDYPVAGDGVVPDQSTDNYCGFELYNNKSKLDALIYPSENHTHSVSSSSLEVGVVPDGNTISSEASYPTEQTAVQLQGVDRKMRVLRYREKKKNRKFQKTIRYASRKAYAEIRPRIKGRFVKRTEFNAKIDGFFVGADFLSGDAQYGVVPSL